jgi:hypothetical protein
LRHQPQGLARLGVSDIETRSIAVRAIHSQDSPKHPANARPDRVNGAAPFVFVMELAFIIAARLVSQSVKNGPVQLRQVLPDTQIFSCRYRNNTATKAAIPAINMFRNFLHVVSQYLSPLILYPESCV